MNALAIAESRLLAPAGLDTDALQRAFASLLAIHAALKVDPAEAIGG